MATRWIGGKGPLAVVREDALDVAAPAVAAAGGGPVPVEEARAAFQAAVQREEEIRAGRADAELGIAGAAEAAAAAEADRQRLMRELARGGNAFSPDVLAQKRADKADAERRKAEADGLLRERVELQALAEEQTEEKEKVLDRSLRVAVAEEIKLVDVSKVEDARARDRANEKFVEKDNASHAAGQVLRGSFGARATVADLEEQLLILRGIRGS